MAVEQLLKGTNMKWANAESRMNIYNIRLHMRVLRRLSMAVLDQGDPKYEESALAYFDKNEEIFGRKGKQVAVLQESTKALDAFQADLLLCRRLNSYPPACPGQLKPRPHVCPLAPGPSGACLGIQGRFCSCTYIL